MPRSQRGHLILTAWWDKLPVYLELPSDIAYLDIEIPPAPLVLAQPPSDPERLGSCTAAIARQLSNAASRLDEVLPVRALSHLRARPLLLAQEPA